MLPVVPEATEAKQQYEALHTALHQFVESTHAEWYNSLQGNFAPALSNSLLLQDKAQGGLLIMNFDKELMKMLQEVSVKNCSTKACSVDSMHCMNLSITPVETRMASVSRVCPDTATQTWLLLLRAHVLGQCCGDTYCSHHLLLQQLQRTCNLPRMLPPLY